MRTLHLAAIAIATACATLASAQVTQPRQTTSNGFFRPAADPNLTAPTPAQRAQAAAPATKGITRPTESIVAEDRAPDPAKVMQWSEQQADRSEREARAARAATPTPINGAFTGSTDERSR